MFYVSTVAPVMNLRVRGVTDRTIDLEWEGSVVLTDFLVTYTPSSAGGKYRTFEAGKLAIEASVYYFKITLSFFKKKKKGV